MTAFWSFVLTFLTSTASRYFFIFLLICMAAGAFYIANQKRIALERAQAIYQYNLDQLQQNIKDKQKLIDDLNQINKDKEKAVALLIQQMNDLNDKMKSIESEVDVSIGKGEDRPASSILKNMFKRLGNQQ